MRVFLAGATGVIGRPLVARLLEDGHEVIGTTRSPDRADGLRELGVEPAVLDARDTDALRGAVLNHPEALEAISRLVVERRAGLDAVQAAARDEAALTAQSQSLIDRMRRFLRL